MSEYTFGNEAEQQEQPDSAVAPKFYRDYMDKVSQQLKALQDRNDALEAAQNRQFVKDALTAKGYAPEAAGLYTGAPDKLDEWLSANGAALARTGGEAAVEATQGAQGAPQSTVSAESQAQQQAFAAAGQGAAGVAASSEDQLVARLRNASSLEELEAIEREQGSRYV